MEERYPGYWECSSEEILRKNFPIHRSCRDGDLEQLCSLLTGDLNGTLSVEDHFYSWTPCHWAANYGQLACLRKLIGFGVDVNASTNRFQQTAAHVAAFGGQAESLLCLIQFGADCNKKDYLGETVLHKAARSGSVDCLKVLLASGIIDISEKNSNGHTVPQLATKSGHQDFKRLLEQLQQNGCSQPMELQPQPQSNGDLTLGATANRKRAVTSLDHHHPHQNGEDMIEAKKPRVFHAASMVDSVVTMETDSGVGESNEEEEKVTEEEEKEDDDDDHVGSSSDIEQVPHANPRSPQICPDTSQPTRSTPCNGQHQPAARHRRAAALVCNGHSSTATDCCSVALEPVPPPTSGMDWGQGAQQGCYGLASAFSSSVEHESCLRVQQGYDSLMHDALTTSEASSWDLDMLGW